MPSYALITKAIQYDYTVAGKFNLKHGSIVAFDRSYYDYCLVSSWTVSGLFFVTRQKESAVYEVIEKRWPPIHRFTLSDKIIWFTGAKAEEKCFHPLRHVVVWDPLCATQIARFWTAVFASLLGKLISLFLFMYLKMTTILVFLSTYPVSTLTSAHNYISTCNPFIS